jgi:hypothetical protein
MSQAAAYRSQQLNRDMGPGLQKVHKVIALQEQELAGFLRQGVG